MAYKFGKNESIKTLIEHAQDFCKDAISICDKHSDGEDATADLEACRDRLNDISGDLEEIGGMIEEARRSLGL